MFKKNKQDSPMSGRDFEKIGRAMESVFESGYANRKRVFTINFMRGVFFGFGSVLGGTIVIAMLIWVLHFFTEIPLIGDLVEKVQTSIDR